MNFASNSDGVAIVTVVGCREWWRCSLSSYDSASGTAAAVVVSWWTWTISLISSVNSLSLYSTGTQLYDRLNKLASSNPALSSLWLWDVLLSRRHTVGYTVQRSTSCPRSQWWIRTTTKCKVLVTGLMTCAVYKLTYLLTYWLITISAAYILILRIIPRIMRNTYRLHCSYEEIAMFAIITVYNSHSGQVAVVSWFPDRSFYDRRQAPSVYSIR